MRDFAKNISFRWIIQLLILDQHCFSILPCNDIIEVEYMKTSYP